MIIYGFFSLTLTPLCKEIFILKFKAVFQNLLQSFLILILGYYLRGFFVTLSNYNSEISKKVSFALKVVTMATTCTIAPPLTTIFVK